MKRTLIGWWCGALSLLCWPALALAAREEETPIIDARYEMYAQNVTREAGSTAWSYALLLFLAIVGLSVLFKDARRSHLD